ncbi:hypothetical protein QR680_018593 [Steinernema hermaphroditum]|uniref:USP domain-containing protein n=1 Tax=Steinernema hermaphroditum TaxID=289476 RepID=A0AA39LRC6_9BILA|nr:hypothetical protein QR680_018593 [Steinernema hermaphroditum]
MIYSYCSPCFISAHAPTNTEEWTRTLLDVFLPSSRPARCPHCHSENLHRWQRFDRQTPWLLPIEVSRFHADVSQAQHLPSQMTFLGVNFRLAGATIQTGSHFTCVIPYAGRWLFYNGMQHPPLRIASPSDGFLNIVIYVPRCD